MKKDKLLLIASCLIFLSILQIHSQEDGIGGFSVEEELAEMGYPPTPTEEDDILIEVPLSYLRNANFYFEGYHIYKEKSDRLQAIVSAYKPMVNSMLGDIIALQAKVAKTNSTLSLLSTTAKNFGIAMLTVGGIVLVVKIIEFIALLLGKG